MVKSILYDWLISLITTAAVVFIDVSYSVYVYIYIAISCYELMNLPSRGYNINTCYCIQTATTTHHYC